MRAALLLLGLALVASCDLSMKRQDRHDAQQAATLWPGGPALAPVPDGAIRFEASRATAPVPAPTAGLMARGRERYDIYCALCHGLTGAGDGPVVARGFQRPPPLARSANLSAQEIYGVIGHGRGALAAFGDRIAPGDRWAITLYVRALQSLDEGAAP
jgi:mono/diheme cytochrome c family protein